MSFLKSSVVKLRIYNNKRIPETIFYPKIDKDDNDIYIITKENDRFDLLAYKYYNDSTFWWIIAKANNIFNGSLFIEPGIQLRIPTNIDLIIKNYINYNG